MNTGRSSQRIAALVIAVAIFAQAAPALAEATIIDPKTWCGDFSRLVAEGKDAAIGEALHSGSLGNIDPAGALVALAPMTALVKSDKVNSVSFLAQKNYADAFERDWYMIVIGPKPTFLRCSFIRVSDDQWQLTDFDFNTSVDELPLP
ncbi:hypothetical protein [Dongia sp.]|uniref:hypothetical protein n=1 Tax=Dongia sp. TaxID=1977262 RepID=UPI003753A65A